MHSFRTGAAAGLLALCAGLGLVYVVPLPAPASVVVTGCANQVGFVHGWGSNIGQNCAGPKIVGGQGTGIATTNGTTLDSSALNVATGNALAVFVGYFTTLKTVTVTDTALNSFTVGTSCDEDGNEHGVWAWAGNVTGNAADVVTAHFSATQGHREITVYQFSGANTSPKDFNGACGSNGSITPTATSAAFTTTFANETLLAGVQGGTNSNTFTAGAGYTLGAAIGGVAGGRTEFKTVNSIQTGVTASMTFGTNTAWVITILTVH